MQSEEVGARGRDVGRGRGEVESTGGEVEGGGAKGSPSARHKFSILLIERCGGKLQF